MKLHRAFLVVLLLGAAACSIFFMPVREWFSLFEAYVYSLGTVGPIVTGLETPVRNGKPASCRTRARNT